MTRDVSLRVIEKSCVGNRGSSSSIRKKRSRTREKRHSGSSAERDIESSTKLFAGPANLSDPIPTSRRKKTFDKRPDVLTKGPNRPGLVFPTNPARRCRFPSE